MSSRFSSLLRPGVWSKAVLGSLVFVPSLYAATLSGTVTDHKGRAVTDAVLVVTPKTSTLAGTVQSQKAVLDQIKQEFAPHAKVVQVGTPIFFPNKDNIRHHVYSFSQAKKFELPLYKGTPANPVVFDRPGVVKLGCNIHDWMLGYVYVVDTPYFAQTGKDGRGRITNVPAGEYSVTLWHPRMKGKVDKTIRHLTLDPDGKAEVNYTLKLRKVFRIRRKRRGRYRR